MITIGGHTFDETLLNGGAIIDIGCRDFTFSKSDLFLNNNVFCIDPDADVFKVVPKRVYIIQAAISDKKGVERYYRNGESTTLERYHKGDEHLMFDCPTITMNDLYNITGHNVDLLKLDCEGAEYIILGDGFLPFPKQITVEWHNHTVPRVHKDNFDKCMKNVLKYYDKVFECQSGMDTLFVKR